VWGCFVWRYARGERVVVIWLPRGCRTVAGLYPQVVSSLDFNLGYDTGMRHSENTVGYSTRGVAHALPHTKHRVPCKVSKFDWKIAEELHSPRVYEFLVANFDKPISEDDFVQQIVLLRKLNLANGNFKGKRRNYRGRTTPATAKKDYNQLKELFGFFV